MIHGQHVGPLQPMSAELTARIVPFPYGATIEANTMTQRLETRLTQLSQLVIDAAVVAYANTPGSELLLLGETLFGPGYANTSQLLEAEARRQQVTALSIRQLTKLQDGRLLNNSYLQAEALAQYAQTAAALPQIVIALEYHLPRVERACLTRGVTASFVSAESLLAGSRDLAPYEAAIDQLRPAERLASFVGYTSIGQRFLNWETTQRGGRVLDIIEQPDGSFAAQRTTAEKQFRQAEVQLEQFDIAA